ncbi:MAG TPA: FAD-dependent monooxygenase [Verrucomicrobiae bacterium]|nr:FAD-dependent monooxygenase [Verrucomicrobiae bacterium]
MRSVYDAVIIGAGPAGATAAALLAAARWSVAVVERSQFPRAKVCGEFVSGTNLPLLERLGILDEFMDQAGPPIRRVGLFGEGPARPPEAQMPRSSDVEESWGRALSRAQLDTMLLARAAALGAVIWQPWSVIKLERQHDEFVCVAGSASGRESVELRGRLVLAAHGSWETGPLPSQLRRQPVRPTDLFGFKARFRNARLPEDLMPLLVFPGGYGGMVTADAGCVSLSCCVRRETLERIRSGCGTGTAPAASAVLAHIRSACREVDQALAGAHLEGNWKSAGPIRPGIRQSPLEGLFLLGNAAGEAHPIVAEGITMAMQSAWLLCRRLIAAGPGSRKTLCGLHLQEDYQRAWRRCFGPRLRAAAWCAQLALRPASARASQAVLRAFPSLLGWGARWSGKASAIVPARDL